VSRQFKSDKRFGGVKSKLGWIGGKRWGIRVECHKLESPKTIIEFVDFLPCHKKITINKEIDLLVGEIQTNEPDPAPS
jgi:hypothetical protein